MSKRLAGMGSLLSLRGRCSRSMYGWFLAGSLICFSATLLIAAVAGLPLLPTFIGLIVLLAAPSVVFAIRRLHDVGLSGWFILLNAIPMVGMVFSWSIAFKRGEVGPNRFADDPLTPKVPRPSKPVAEWTLAVLGGVTMAVAALVCRICLVQAYTDPSAAMEPSLSAGDYVIVSKFAYRVSKHSIPFSPPVFQGRILDHAPRRGDVVVFKLPRDPKVDYIKRLIGMPGDRIQLKSGVVFVNNRPMDRKQAGAGTEDMGGGEIVPVTIYRETTPEGRSYDTNSYGSDQAAENTGIYVVPPHCYFMMGDNRDDSLDSRFDPGMPQQATGPSNCGWDPSVDGALPTEQGVGFVPEENLVGPAILAVALTGKPRPRWLAGR